MLFVNDPGKYFNNLSYIISHECSPSQSSSPDEAMHMFRRDSRVEAIQQSAKYQSDKALKRPHNWTHTVPSHTWRTARRPGSIKVWDHNALRSNRRTKGKLLDILACHLHLSARKNETDPQGVKYDYQEWSRWGDNTITTLSGTLWLDAAQIIRVEMCCYNLELFTVDCGDERLLYWLNCKQMTKEVRSQETSLRKIHVLRKLASPNLYIPLWTLY